MNSWQELLITVAATLIVSLITYGLSLFSSWLKSKTESEEYDTYIDLATEAVSQAVACVSQTYVDSLKEADSFDVTSQREAFNKAKERVFELLSNDTQKTLSKFVGNLDIWVSTKIEQTVKEQKG